MSERRERLKKARLYMVCDVLSQDFVRAALRGGVDVVQLRMKEAPDEEILSAAERLAPLCAAHGALFILNDRPDLAAAAGADGVHLGQDDEPIARARQQLGPHRLIGLSTHTPEQVDDAAGADYIGVGPVYETPTKPGRPAVGLELVRYAADRARVPFFAIGGINAANAAGAVAAGAHRIAVVRALTEAADPEHAARELRGVLVATDARMEERVGAT